MLALSGCAQPGPAAGYVGVVPEEQTPAKTLAALLRAGDSTRAAGDLPSAVTFLSPRPCHRARPGRAADPPGRNTLAALGAHNDASKSFRAAIERDAKDADAHRGLGNALLALASTDLALQSFNAALAIKPDARCYNGIGVANDMTATIAPRKPPTNKDFSSPAAISSSRTISPCRSC